MKWPIAALAVTLLGPTAAAAHRCTVDGRTTYQDLPCPEVGDTAAEAWKRRQRIESWHHNLDQLQARGVGLVQRAAPPPVPPRAADEAPPYIGPQRKGAAPLAYPDAADARLAEQTREKNKANLMRLDTVLETAAENCGGKLVQFPTVGMSDATFRLCTLHARFGGATQVVALEMGGVPLRLYVFPTTKAQRVYSVGGVITAIKP